MTNTRPRHHAASSLEIRLLGPFALSVDGAAVQEQRFPRRKPKLLLKLLALQPHHQLHREQVMEFLWPDLDVSGAANNLHKSIHAARRALEPSLKSGSDSQFIVTHEQQIQLRAPGGLSIDVEKFERAAATALKSTELETYERAVELYSGDLLLEDPYEEWTVARRESLRQLYSDLLSKLGQLYEGQQQYQQSIDIFKQLLGRDAANEEVHRALMRLYALTGNRHYAIRQFQQCAETVRREFGTEPDSKTVELHKRIESGQIQPHIASIDAQNAYLKGRYYWNKRTEAGLKKAIEYFDQAVTADPDFAPAYAGLAESYACFSSYSIQRPRQSYPPGRVAALKALQLDNSLAEAHAALAWIKCGYDWDWAGAEQEHRRAIELNPNYATARHWYALFLSAMERHEEAIAEIKRALELDPLSRVINRDVGWVLYWARRYDEAIDASRKTIELDPNFYLAHYFFGETYEAAGRHAEAIAEFRDTRTHAKEEAEVWTLFGHACAHALLGERDQAHRIIDDLRKLSRDRYISPYIMATIYVRLGEKDQAFEQLERAYEERDNYLVWIMVEPVMDDLRSDPRFMDLVRRVGFNPQQRISRIAILPLLNESSDPEMDYLSDGLTENIINNLSQLPELRVMAWGTVARYKGRTISPAEAGRALGVSAILAGNVLQAAQRLIVRVELIDCADGARLWGGRFDRELADILAVQEEIANEISENLKLRLTREEKKRLSKRHTDNPEAYRLYLKGRYFWYKRTEEALRKGIDFFNKAIECDPSYALAYDGLSDSYALLALRGIEAPREAFAKARATARKALEIDESLGEAYASLAHVKLHDWDWSGLDDDFKRALKLSPGNCIAYHWYSEYLTAMGRTAESIAAVRKAEEMDPLSPVIGLTVAVALYFAYEFDQAIEQLLKAIAIDPHHFSPHLKLGLTYLRKCWYEKGLEEIQQAVKLSARSNETLAALAQGFSLAGMKTEAETVIAELLERSKGRYVSPYYMAMVYACSGDKEEAFAWLEKGYQERNPDFIDLRGEPALNPLRSDPRFDDLLRRVGFAENIAPCRIDAAPSAVPSATVDSLAIFPLVNSSTDANAEYLSDGITESIINSLSQLPELKVMARSTVFRYKGQQFDPQEVGQKLGVRAVLTGRVLSRGDVLNIQTELVDVQDGRQLWGEQYKRKAADILEVQEEIAREIVGKLRVRLTGQDNERLGKRYTANSKAYELYLKGRYHWNKRTAERLQKAIECFQQAIEIDQKFALAYAGISDCYAFLGDVGLGAIPSKEAFSRAKEAARQALKIDDSLAEAYQSLAHAHMHFFEWPEALRAFQRAMELSPNHPISHQWYAFYLLFHGRGADAIAEVARALELDPLSVTAQNDLGQMFHYTGDSDRAIEQYFKTLELEPEHHKTYLWLGWAYMQKEMYAEAIESFRKAEVDYKPEALASLGYAFAISGKKDDAQSVLQQIEATAVQSYVSPYYMSLLFLSLGDDGRAFEWLEKGYEQRAEWMIYLSVDPRFDRLRADPRFGEILRKIGFAA